MMADRARGRGGRHERRLSDLSIHPEDDTFRPYRVDTSHSEFTVELNLDGDRLVVQEWRDLQSGALSDFVVSQQTLDAEGGDWKDVALVDAKHGTVHIHRYRRSGSEISRAEISGYSTREQLEDIYRGIHDHMFDTWEDNRRRWAAGR